MDDEIEALRQILRSPRGHEGEDHRDGPPGYDFDEQLVIERHQARKRLLELGVELNEEDLRDP
jgi:hypothetical protein